jgi:glycosyltransferase involved in cell wall biosynthesis
MTARPVHLARVAARKFYYVQAYEPDFYPRKLHFEPQRWLAKRSYTYPLGLVANCPMVARQCAGSRGSLVPIVPPGIDPELYHARERRPEGPRLVVGTISRSEFWKGSADCFEAVRRVRATGVKVDFRVAFGNIPAGYEAEPRIDDAPADDRQLAGWYRGLDVLIAAVHDGGAPYPPIEAMACGTAVVSTPNEHVADGRNALVAPQEDPAALASALARMLGEPGTREQLVRQGLEDVKQHHWENVVKRMEDVFTGAVVAPLGRP